MPDIKDALALLAVGMLVFAVIAAIALVLMLVMLGCVHLQIRWEQRQRKKSSTPETDPLYGLPANATKDQVDDAIASFLVKE